MSYFSDEELWRLRGRSAAVSMFVGSCLHLLRASEVLKEAEAKRFISSIESGLGGIAIQIAEWGKPESLGVATSYRWFDHTDEGFSLRIELETASYPAEFLAVFAEDVTCVEQVLTFRISRERLEAMVADWLARGRPIPGVIPVEIKPPVAHRD